MPDLSGKAWLWICNIFACKLELPVVFQPDSYNRIFQHNEN